MGQVVSVNLAEPRVLMRRGREVRTGLWKRPVDGPVLVGELGLQGDLVGDLRVHGGRDKAVYAYAVDDIRWWEDELERDLGPGFFGENLTVRGIDASGARPGERWEVGQALLEVTEPRSPCWKLAEKVGVPGFMKRFVAAQRPGTYLRVVREGEVAAGDRVRVLSPRRRSSRSPAPA